MYLFTKTPNRVVHNKRDGPENVTIYGLRRTKYRTGAEDRTRRGKNSYISIGDRKNETIEWYLGEGDEMRRK